MNLNAVAFFLGFAGSLHCAVMCGPILLGLPFQKTSAAKMLLQLLLYQVGRILIYGLLGMIAGAAGERFSALSNQTVLSYCIGGLMIAIFIFHFINVRSKGNGILQQWVISTFGKVISRFFGTPYYAAFAGMLNGLIPCGMVYLALSTSLSAGGALDGGLFMLVFGLGTAPLLLFISMGGNFIRRHLRFNTLKLLPYAALFIGVLFLFRAMQLNIPFLSPLIEMRHNGVEVCR